MESYLTERQAERLWSALGEEWEAHRRVNRGLLFQVDTWEPPPPIGNRSTLVPVLAYSDEDYVRKLVATGVDVNTADALGTTALHLASRKGDAERARLLIELGAVDRPDVFGRTAVILAALHGNNEALQVLLAAGFSPDAQDAKGWTALHYAVALGDPIKVGTLLDHRADPTIPTKEGHTAMDIANWVDRKEISNLLQERGVASGRQEENKKQELDI